MAEVSAPFDLKQAVAKFERLFAKVVEFDPGEPQASRVPSHDIPYVVLCSGGIKPEGDVTESFVSEIQAVDKWEIAATYYASMQAPGRTLFWRVRPEIVTDRLRKRFYVYSRLAII